MGSHRHTLQSGWHQHDRLPLKTPEIINAYVEPSAIARFSQTGIWPDGSQIDRLRRDHAYLC
jgi:hypothetical protein